TGVFLESGCAGGGTPGGGLVEQDHLRIERESRCHVEELLLALRQRGSRGIEPVTETEDIGHFTDARPHRRIGGQQREQPPALLLTRYHGGRGPLRPPR